MEQAKKTAAYRVITDSGGRRSFRFFCDILYPDGVPAIYTLKNFALAKVDGDTTYAEYVAAHSAEWTNILTNLGFYWADSSAAVAEPDWDNLDWATLTQKAAE